jgi:hypothetical protein
MNSVRGEEEQHFILDELEIETENVESDPHLELTDLGQNFFE